MRSLWMMCAPIVIVCVEPPGGVLSEVGLTAVAVPTSCAAAGFAISIALASKRAVVVQGTMIHSQNLIDGPAVTERSCIANAATFEWSLRYCTRDARTNFCQIGISSPRLTRHSVTCAAISGSTDGSAAL